MGTAGCGIWSTGPLHSSAWLDCSGRKGLRRKQQGSCLTAVLARHTGRTRSWLHCRVQPSDGTVMMIVPCRRAMLGSSWVLGHSAPHPTRVMHCLLTLSPDEQRKLCLCLKSSAVYWTFTRSSTLDPEVQTALARRGNVVAVFQVQV